MAIELYRLHPSHDDELTRLKARIAELESAIDKEKSWSGTLSKNGVTMSHEIERLKSENERMKARIADLEEERRWRKFSEEKPPKYTWCLVSGKNQMGNYIVIMDFFEEDDWAENQNLVHDTLDIEWWMPLQSAPKEE